MNKRLLQFLAAENVTQTQFAETLDVAKASVSNILAGKNRPGYDFIESLMLHYPDLNIEWLITGKGRMYRDKGAVSPAGAASEDLFFGDIPVQEDVPAPNAAPSIDIDTLNKPAQSPVSQRKVTGICIFFDDGTFQDIRIP